MSDVYTLPGQDVTACMRDLWGPDARGNQKGAAAASARDRHGLAYEPLRPAHVFVPEPAGGRP